MIKEFIFDSDNDVFYENENGIIETSDYILPNLYDRFGFHNYHQKFVDEVFLFGVKSNKKTIGYCYFGYKEETILAPYSSPFALIYFKKNYKIEDVCIFVDSIKKFANKKKIHKISFVLPPEIYDLELVNTLNSALFSGGFNVKSIDINNYIDLTEYINLETYLENSPYHIRKNYKRSLQCGLKFEQLDNISFEIAYDVIKINREKMGKPLRISKQQMRDLINLEFLSIRIFIVKKESIIIAAAIIFDVNDDTSQIIYWGDIPEYRIERGMNLLAAEIFSVYKKLGKKYLDIGISSENGVINLGLFDFKKSIGCKSDIKVSFEYVIK